jgi:glycerol-3-phosphate dehydrogenase (NAD(P)+)
MTRANTVGIVGAGTFGSALGSVLARAGRRTILWSRDTAVVEAIQRERRSPRLPAAPLPEPLEATADPRRLAAEARFIVLAVNSADVRDRARELGDVLDGSHIVVHAIGALAAPSNERVSEVMSRGLPTLKLGVLAGPALPADLAEGQFSSMVAASAFDEVVHEARRLLNAPPTLRVYGSKDLIGVELASALSGAYTVALGLSDGLGMTAGPRAVLITRAIAEASRLGSAAGAEPKTFSGLAGLGNILVRSSSERSGDYLLGRRLAEGVMTADNARSEGARAAIAGCELAKQLRVRMPVLNGLAAILSGKIEPKDAAHLVGDSVAMEE